MAKTSPKISSVVYNSSEDHYLVSLSDGAPGCLQRTVVDVLVENHPATVLLDAEASENFFNDSLIERLGINCVKFTSNVTMASEELQLTTSGRSFLTIMLFGKTYKNTLMDVMTNASCDVILGQKFLGRH